MMQEVAQGGLEKTIATSYSNIVNREYNIEWASIDKIKPDLEQPRQHLNEISLEELAQSIEAEGLIVPPVAQKMPDGTFELIVGHRRYFACLMNGYNEIPIRVVEDITDLERIEIQIHEDSQKPFKSWKVAENIVDFLRLAQQEDPSITQEDVALHFGYGRTSVERAVRYVDKVTQGVKNLVIDGKIGYKVAADNIYKIPSNQDQYRAALKIAKKEIKPELEVQKHLPEEKSKSAGDLELTIQTEEGLKAQEETQRVKKVTQALDTTVQRLATLLALSNIKDVTWDTITSCKDHYSGESLEDTINKFEVYVQELSDKFESEPEKLLARQELIRKRARVGAPITEVYNNALEKHAKTKQKTKRPDCLYDTLVENIQLKLIDEDPQNARGNETITEENVKELAKSIKSIGIINPLLLEKEGKRYNVVFGHIRRLGAKEAKEKTVPAIVVNNLTRQQKLALQMTEASQKAFSAEDRATAHYKYYNRLKEAGVISSIEDFAQRIGVNEQIAVDAVRYNEQVTQQVKKLVHYNVLNYTTALTLAQLSEERQNELSVEIAIKNQGLTETRRLIKQKKQSELFPDEVKGIGVVVSKQLMQAMEEFNIAYEELRMQENDFHKKALKQIAGLTNQFEELKKLKAA
ncbi:ParB/RepB/Spo0J family partition protein [Candidatus Woesearchaeota archaeon]|nr:ParB/RepB/Spo0J family partition protein [Candidatus Woesearchaeota archaeon]